MSGVRSESAIRSAPQVNDVLRFYGRDRRAYTVAEVCSGWVYYDVSYSGEPSGGDRMTLAQWAALS